ncbi:hypothetical protein HPB47_015040 [Ixodes persulcatus]|uniref:Uncharacterized protein n=1 Tax=Ixodes persulcatus TaxID=34615 RepID=A0AC60QWE5_IXOPE|nr:hypothetical protein HPB47_015040 [Ixodes persulcatus]
MPRRAALNVTPIEIGVGSRGPSTDPSYAARCKNYDDGYGAQTNGDQDRYEGPPERYVASHGPGGTHSSSSGGSTPRTRQRAAADQGETGEGPDPKSLDLMARVANLCDTYTGYDDRKSVADFLAELAAYKLATGASDEYVLARRSPGTPRAEPAGEVLAAPTSTSTWTREGGGGASGTEYVRLRRRAVPDFQQPLRLEQEARALAVATTQPRVNMAWQVKIWNASTPTPWANEYRWQAQQAFRQQSRLGSMDRQVTCLGFRLLYKRLYKPPCEE